MSNHAVRSVWLLLRVPRILHLDRSLSCGQSFCDYALAILWRRFRALYKEGQW